VVKVVRLLIRALRHLKGVTSIQDTSWALEKDLSRSHDTNIWQEIKGRYPAIGMETFPTHRIMIICCRYAWFIERCLSIKT
jgi:hypothetical protein